MTSNSTFQAHVYHMVRRPDGLPKPDDFALRAVTLPAPGPGQFIVRNAWLSVDPYMRLPLTDQEGFHAPLQEGEAMDGGAVGAVIASNHPDFPEGSFVAGMSGGWRDLHLTDGTGLNRVDPNLAPLQAFLGVLGLPGLTGYAGVMQVLKPQPGETVLMTAAAGAVGLVGSQMAKAAGARVIALTGADEKADFLRDEVGLDVVINYRTAPDLETAVRAVAPDGVEMIFENVGAEMLNMGLRLLKPHGRMAICGMVAQYNNPNPRRYDYDLFTTVEKMLTLRGFNLSEFMANAPAMIGDLAPRLASGDLVWRETVVDGLEAMPDALAGVLSGANTGKMLVKI